MTITSHIFIDKKMKRYKLPNKIVRLLWNSLMTCLYDDFIFNRIASLLSCFIFDRWKNERRKNKNLDNVGHLILVDRPISVDIVKAKREL